ncbi:hypothetical protein D3C78_821860 [compost metagenome]
MTRLSSKPISPISTDTTTQASAIWPNAWASTSVRLRLDSTRQGVPTFSTRRATKSVG